MRLAGIATAVVAVGVGPGPATAEPVIDRALSGVQVLHQKGCALLKVTFNFRAQYVSHFPQSAGQELRLTVRPVDRSLEPALKILKREALRAPTEKIPALKAIDFETNLPGGPLLIVQFQASVNFKVAQGTDFESVVIAIGDRPGVPGCQPIFPDAGRDAWSTTIVRPPSAAADRATVAVAVERAAGKISSADLRLAAGSMDEARAALKKGNTAEAVQILTKVLRLPENEHSAEAQELLGLARQRSGQSVLARAHFEDYLRRYPSGEGSERVRQRLAGIVTAQVDHSGKLRPSREQQMSAAPGTTSGRTGETTWSVSGSASQFFIRDDSFRVVRDPSLPPTPNDDPDAHRVHQNALLSSLDLTAAWESAAFKSKVRFSGTEDHGFNADGRDITSVATLFLETTYKDWGLQGRLGRQTRNGGGVIGRFDGGVLSWQANPWLRVNAVGGSPVVSRIDEPFKDDKLFYGASVDLGPFFGGFDMSLFAIEQRDRDILDRRAIGAEARYFDADKSVFALLDYDVHFAQLNAAVLSSSWTLADKSTLHGGIDYRKSPYLSMWTALQGQPFVTLYDLLKWRTREELRLWALDRTATYQSATAGYSRPISDKFQISFDVTASNVSGTPASGGIEAMPASGDEFYYSTQLTGTNLFQEGDLSLIGLRYADRKDSDLYVLDLSTRFPITADWRVNPRLRFSYRKGDKIDLTEFAVLPSVLLNYHWSKNLNFELEVGAKWTTREQALVKSEDTDLFFTVGYRYDFYADSRTPCAPLNINCR